MKALLIFPLVAMAFLCGCAESAPEKETEKQITELQQRISDVTNELNDLRAAHEDSMVIQSNLEEIMEEDLGARASSEATPDGGPPINPATGLPTVLDLKTGLPVDLPLVVLKATGEAGETNNQWWRWSVKYVVWNPNPEPETRNAEIKFIGEDYHVIDTATQYPLTVRGYSTKTFTSQELVFMPGAAKVKSFDVQLEQ